MPMQDTEFPEKRAPDMDHLPDARGASLSPQEPGLRASEAGDMTAASAEDRGNGPAQETPPTPGSLASLLAHPSAPWWVLALVALSAVLYLGWGVRGSLTGGLGSMFGHKLSTTSVVVFDPVRFANAQRAAVSILQTSKDPDIALSLTQVANQAEQVILEEANGALVLIRQAVVVPEGVPDITDAVLTRFGLSTQAPTVSINPASKAKSFLEAAPTDSAYSEQSLREDYLIQLRQQEEREAAKNDDKSRQRSMLP